MLGVMNARPKMTYAEYLAREATAEVKHEFIAGEVFEWGAARFGDCAFEHGALSNALATALAHGLSGRPFQVLRSEFSADVSVVCDAAPVLLAEVLAPSTEADDRGAKAAQYRRLDSLKEYVLVSLTERRIEVQRRNERGIWELHFFGPGEHVELNSVGVRLSVDALYANPLQ